MLQVDSVPFTPDLFIKEHYVEHEEHKYQKVTQDSDIGKCLPFNLCVWQKEAIKLDHLYVAVVAQIEPVLLSPLHFTLIHEVLIRVWRESEIHHTELLVRADFLKLVLKRKWECTDLLSFTESIIAIGEDSNTKVINLGYLACVTGHLDCVLLEAILIVKVIGRGLSKVSESQRCEVSLERAGFLLLHCRATGEEDEGGQTQQCAQEKDADVVLDLLEVDHHPEAKTLLDLAPLNVPAAWAEVAKV